MQHEDREQPRAGNPDQRTEVVLEKIGIAVDGIRPTEHLQIADHVEDDKRHQSNPGQGHNDLGTNARIEQCQKERPRTAGRFEFWLTLRMARRGSRGSHVRMQLVRIQISLLAF